MAARLSSATQRRLLVSALAVLTLAFAACSSPATPPAPVPVTSATSAEALLGDIGLADLSVTDVIDQLDAMAVTDRPSNIFASVRPDALIVSDDQGREVTLPMPEDQVYVSVAPYENQTHDCFFHSLTTCRGELANTTVTVKLVDAATGNVIVDENRQTFDNGFVGLWLPRGIEGPLTITLNGQSGTVPLSTKYVDDATCITTLRLT